MNANLTSAYRFHRLAGCGALRAISLARVDAEDNRRRFPSTGLASYQNTPSERGGRWIERPDLAGLRFVGWSDNIARDIAHEGWWNDPHGDGSVVRGAVYQLPARQGECIFVEGHVTLERGCEQSTGTSDTSRMPAVVYLNDRHTGHVFDGEWVCDAQAARNAARGADREAEIYAEKAREYQENYQSGQDASDAIEKAKSQRVVARELLSAMRDATLPDLIRDRTRRDVTDILRAARQQRDTAKSLWGQFGDSDAFRDGAGASSYAESLK